MKGLGAILVFVSIPLLLQSGQPTQPAMTASFEHVAFNVADAAAVTKWYVDNMGMKVPKAGFVSDAAGRMMFEIYHKTDAKVMDLKQIDPNSFHIAFETSNIQPMIDKLVKAGATVAKPLSGSDTGDSVVTLRDPWGLPIQLVKRAKPLLTR